MSEGTRSGSVGHGVDGEKEFFSQRVSAAAPPQATNESPSNYQREQARIFERRQWKADAARLEREGVSH